MSWIREDSKSYIHRFCTNVLRAGRIPRHVAFIMDGNRRFARKRNYEHVKGHLLGFDKLSQTLEWCLDLNILEVTVYAFSIENFKRSKDEVDGLMELAREKFARLLQEREFLDKHGVCVRVLGNVDLLPNDIQKLIAEGVDMTKHNTRAVLNVCIAYTSRDEMTTAIRDVTEGVATHMLEASDITSSLLERCFYSRHSEAPDLLIRTSGEVRLSDFLLWQSGYSVLSFVQVLWPEFSRWHLYAGLLHYQMNIDAVEKARADAEQRLQQMTFDDTKCDTLSSASAGDLSNSSASCCREERVANFLDYLEQRSARKLDEILATC